MPEHRFDGVTSDSFLGYLQGLGMLKIVGTQLDRAARASWREGRFELTTHPDLADIEEFFLERWVPAPVISPWNGGSGFYAKDAGPNAAFAPIDASEDPRLAPLQEARRTGREALTALGLTEKPDPKSQKGALIRRLRGVLDDQALEWLDAAVVVSGSDLGYPPALGSGGNDGRYDISANHAASVSEVLGLGPRSLGAEASREALQTLLMGQGGTLRAMSLGQFRRDTSWVAAPAGEPEAYANPWDLPFAVEGAMLLAGAASRRLEHGQAKAVAPFVMRPTAAGYGTAVAGETTRAELWMPRWSSPATLAEVRALLREGRANVGRRQATSALDAARAAGSLGVARGVERFERFAILQRAGDANLTLHAGTVAVHPRPAAAVVDGLDRDGWLRRVTSLAREERPSLLRGAGRALEEAAFAVAERGMASDVERLTVAMGRAELALQRSGVEIPHPIAPPAGPWLAVLDLGSAEIRVAAALASLHDPRHGGWIRRALRGTEARAPYDSRAEVVVPSQGAGRERLAALAVRREIMASVRHAEPSENLAGSFAFERGLTLSANDLALLARGGVDLDRLANLLDGLCLLDFRGAWWPEEMTRPTSTSPLPPAFSALLVAAHGTPRLEAVDASQPVLPAATLQRLVAGRVGDVLRDVYVRLRSAELLPVAHVSDLIPGAPDGRDMAIALFCRPSVSARWQALRLTTLDATEPDADKQEPTQEDTPHDR